MTPKPRLSRKPSQARRSHARYSTIHRDLSARPPVWGINLKGKTKSYIHERNLETIGSVSEAETSTATVVSTLRGDIASKDKRSKVSTWASVAAAPISGTATEEPPKRTREEKAARKKALKAARKENPRLDPNFVQLPKGLNNKISDKDPLRARLKRLFQPKKKITHQPLDRTQVVPTPKLGYKFDHAEPAPVRYVPVIAPARGLGERIEQENNGASLGGNFQAYSTATDEDRANRIKEVQLQHDLRKATNMRLRLEGREQVNDPLIGRAPPMKAARLNTAVTSQEVLLAQQARPHMWDHLRLSGGLHTSEENLVEGTTPFTSREIVPSKKPLHSHSSKMPRLKLTVSFADSVESFTIPSMEDEDSITEEFKGKDNSQDSVTSAFTTGINHPPEFQIDSIDPMVNENSPRGYSSKRSKLSTLHAEGEKDIPENSKDNESQHKLRAFYNGSSDSAVDSYCGGSKPFNEKSMTLYKDSSKSDNLVIGESSLRVVGLLDQASPKEDFYSASYDQKTKLLLSSNTPAPGLPTKSPLRQSSQKLLASGLVKDNFTSAIINPVTKSEVAVYLSDLIRLKEIHEEKMNFLKKKRYEHRLENGDLQDPGAPVVKPPHKLKARLSRLFAGGFKSAKSLDNQQGVEQKEVVVDQEGEDAFKNSNHFHVTEYPQSFVDDLREQQRSSFVSVTSSRDQKPAPRGQGGGNTLGSGSGSGSGSGGDCTVGDGLQRPFLERLTPQQRCYYDYNYVAQTPEANAVESKEAREERLLKAEQDSALANEAVVAGHRSLLKDFDTIYGAADFSSSHGRGMTRDNSTSDRANNKHVTFGALSHEVRGLPNSPAFTTAANSSFRQSSQTSSGYKNQKKLSLQIPEVAEDRDLGGSGRRLSPQFTAPQQTEISRLPLGALSYATSSSRQYSKEESSKWINSDTILAEESDTDGVYRAYYQSSGSYKVPIKQTTINHEGESNEFSTLDDQKISNLRRGAQARRVHREPQIIEEPQSHPRPAPTEAEEEAEFQRLRSQRGSDPNPVRTARRRYPLLINRYPRTGAEENELVALRTTNHSDDTLRQQPVTEEIVTSDPASEQRISKALGDHRPDPNPELEVYARRLLHAPEELFKRDQARKAAAQRLGVSTAINVNHNRALQTPAAIKSGKLPVSTAIDRVRESQAPTAVDSIRALQAPAAVNPSRRLPVPIAINRARELLVLPTLDSAEADRLRVVRARQRTCELQSNRDISTGSPLSRGASTFGYDSLLSAPQRNLTSSGQRAYHSQLSQSPSSPGHHLQVSSPSLQGNRGQRSSSGLRNPQDWSQNSSPTNQEPLVISHLPQPSYSSRQATLVPRSLPSVPNSDRQAKTSISRLPTPGITVTPGSPTLQPS